MATVSQQNEGERDLNDFMASTRYVDDRLCSTSANPLSRSFTQSNLITLIVGKDQEQYVVHQEILTKHSKFFAGCLQNECVEANNKEIKLPDVRSFGARKFVEWVYTGKIEICNLREIVPAYQFADKICAEVYTNQLMDTIRAHCSQMEKLLGGAIVKDLYEVGLRGKPIAEFAIQDNVFNMSLGDSVDVVDINLFRHAATCSEVAEDLMKAMLFFQKKPWDKPADRRGCWYHEHTEGRLCSTK